MGNAAFSSMAKYQNKYHVSIYKYSYPYIECLQQLEVYIDLLYLVLINIYDHKRY